MKRVGSRNFEHYAGYQSMYMHRKAAVVAKQTQTVINTKDINHSINKHWESMPEEARKFILEKEDTSIHGFAKFWSRPSVKQYTMGNIASSGCGASWFIALQYLKLGLVREAKALTLNGAFLDQCFVSSLLLNIADLTVPYTFIFY